MSISEKVIKYIYSLNIPINKDSLEGHNNVSWLGQARKIFGTDHSISFGWHYQ